MRELVHGSGRQARRHPLGGLAEQGKLPWRQSSNVVRELARLVVRSEVSEKVMLEFSLRLWLVLVPWSQGPLLNLATACARVRGGNTARC